MEIEDEVAVPIVHFDDGPATGKGFERASCLATLTLRRGCGVIIRCDRSG